MSTHDTPRMIRCYDQDLTHLHVPRGLREPLEALADREDTWLALTEARPEPLTVEVTFRGALSGLQQAAVGAVLDHDLGTLVASPGTGKTVMGCAVIAARAVPTLVLVHRKPLVEQWRQELTERLGLETAQIGQIGGGRDRPSGVVDIAMLQTLTRRDDLTEVFAGYPLLIADECHHIPAQSFEQVMRAAPARWVLGLTATRYRRDGLEGQITMQCGPVRHTVEVGQALADHGLTLNLQVHETALTLDSEDLQIQQVFRAIVDDADRTSQICHDIRQARTAGARSLVLTQRKDHLYDMADRLAELDPLVLEGGLGVGPAEPRASVSPTSPPTSPAWSSRPASTSVKGSTALRWTRCS